MCARGIRLQSKTIGKCIYCGGVDQLTVEHALPLGLGGDLKLKDACCEECRTGIHPFETRFLSNVLGPIRHGRLMKSRRRGKKDLPRGAMVMVKSVDQTTGNLVDNTKTKTFVAADDLPKFSFKLPRYLLPPYLMMAPTEQQKQRRDTRYIQTCIDRGDACHQGKHLGGIIDLECDEDAICRSLAKIAHSISVGWLGIDGWEQHLCPYIVGGDLPGPIENYIGGQFAFVADGLYERSETENVVRVTIHLNPLNDDPGNRAVFVNIHILPNVALARPPMERFPFYGVFVGKCGEEKYRSIL